MQAMTEATTTTARTGTPMNNEYLSVFDLRTEPKTDLLLESDSFSDSVPFIVGLGLRDGCPDGPGSPDGLGCLDGLVSPDGLGFGLPDGSPDGLGLLECSPDGLGCPDGLPDGFGFLDGSPDGLGGLVGMSILCSSAMRENLREELSSLT